MNKLFSLRSFYLSNPKEIGLLKCNKGPFFQLVFIACISNTFFVYFLLLHTVHLKM